MPPHVGTGNHDHFFADHAIEHAVRKAPQQRSPRLPVDDDMTEGILRDPGQSGLESIAKLKTETPPLPLVPGKRVLDIRGSGWAKDY
jgi:hypothetical protein